MYMYSLRSVYLDTDYHHHDIRMQYHIYTAYVNNTHHNT